MLRGFGAGLLACSLVFVVCCGKSNGGGLFQPAGASGAADALAGAPGAGESGTSTAGSAGVAGASGGASGGRGGTTSSGGSSAAGASAGGGGAQGGAGAPGVSCPSEAPADGAPCDRAGRCTYLNCAGSGRVSAVCDGQTFSVESFPCDMTVTQCGGSTCATDMLCVEQVSGVATRQCVANPCGTGAITCDCASALCPKDWSCSALMTTITCQSPCTKGCP